MKALTCGTKEQQAAVYKEAGVKPRNLRAMLFKQFETGEAMNKFFALKAKGGDEENEDEGSD